MNTQTPVHTRHSDLLADAEPGPAEHPLYDAFGEHSGEFHARGDERRFLLVFAVVSVLIISAVVAFNAAVDPYGTLGHHWVPPVEQQSSERNGKVDLLAQMDPKPKALLLGTSTMRMYDPHYHEKVSGDPAFNAAVSGASLRTAYAFAAYAHEDLDLEPHLVWGLDVEGLAKRPEQPLGDGRLQSKLPRGDRWSSKLTALRPIADLRTVDVSLKALQTRDERSAPTDTGKKALALAQKKFDENGFVRKDPLEGVDRDARLVQATERYANTVYRNGGYTELDADMQDYVRRTVELANDWGDTPTIVLMPLHPTAHKTLGPLGWDARHDDIKRFLKGLQDDGLKLKVVDFGDPKSFGADVNKFHDGVHMHKETLHLMIDELEKRGAL